MLIPTTPEPSADLRLYPLPLPFLPGGAIFDCDGTLADTMPLHYEAWRKTLDPLNAPFPEETFYAWGGVTAFEIIDRLNALHGLQIPSHQTALQKEADYQKRIAGVRPIAAVVEEARRLGDAGIPLAVASGGIRAVVEETLRTLGILDWFGAIATADDVENGKPAPDVFLLAAERLGVAPENCVVYEDAPAGLEAARRAGMGAVDINVWVETAGKAALARAQKNPAS